MDQRTAPCLFLPRLNDFADRAGPATDRFACRHASAAHHPIIREALCFRAVRPSVRVCVRACPG